MMKYSLLFITADFSFKKIRHTGAGIDLISLNRDYETIEVLNSDVHWFAVLGKKYGAEVKLSRFNLFYFYLETVLN